MPGKRGKNEGSIRKRADGTWEARYTRGRGPDGGQARRSVYGRTRQEAAQKLAAALSEIRDGTYADPAKMTVGEWLRVWLNEYKRPSVKPKTLESYEQTIRLYLAPHIGHIGVRDLRPDHVQRMLNAIRGTVPAREATKAANLEKALGRAAPGGIGEASPARISARTAEYARAVLRAAYEQAVKNGIAARNPAKLVAAPKSERKERRALSRGEQAALLSALAPHRLYAAYATCLALGLRQGEALALKWEDVDFARGLVRVRRNLQRIGRAGAPGAKTALVFGTPKSGKARDIPLTEGMAGLLSRHKASQGKERLALGAAYADGGLVFCTELGTPIEPRRFHATLKRAAASAGLEGVHPHTLRHTFATRGLESGVTLKEMQEFLGHASISITGDIYGHVMPEQKREAMKKLGGAIKV